MNGNHVYRAVHVENRKFQIFIGLGRTFTLKIVPRNIAQSTDHGLRLGGLRTVTKTQGYPLYSSPTFFPFVCGFSEMFYHQTVNTNVFPNQNRSGLKKSLHQSDSSSRRYASPKSHRGSKRGAPTCNFLFSRLNFTVWFSNHTVKFSRENRFLGHNFFSMCCISTMRSRIDANFFLNHFYFD